MPATSGGVISNGERLVDWNWCRLCWTHVTSPPGRRDPRPRSKDAEDDGHAACVPGVNHSNGLYCTSANSLLNDCVDVLAFTGVKKMLQASINKTTWSVTCKVTSRGT